jgi:pSer/pThr/pTyr-binding forkhead associated (FHA) protein
LFEGGKQSIKKYGDRAMPKLFFAIVASGPLKGKKFPISADSKILIGRDEEAQIKLESDLFCSRKHALLYLEGDGCFVEDLNSTNGTSLNRMRITDKTEVKNKDIIHAGDTDILIAEINK